jgi:hypothetical protein
MANLNRRTFCAVAAGATSRELPAAFRKIKAAVIGTGHGHAFSKIQALRTLAEFEFAGVCRPDPDEPGEGAALKGRVTLSVALFQQMPAAIVLVQRHPVTAPDLYERCPKAS